MLENQHASTCGKGRHRGSQHVTIGTKHFKEGGYGVLVTLSWSPPEVQCNGHTHTTVPSMLRNIVCVATAASIERQVPHTCTTNEREAIRREAQVIPAILGHQYTWQ